MPLPVIAIFDVGKTNKKLLLFDQQYRIAWETSATLPETTDEDGDPGEDLAQLTRWVLDSARRAMALPQFAVRAINFSAYGASLVYLDAGGQPVAPLYNYLKPYPEALQRQFSDQYDPTGALAVETASPALGSLNSGLMLYRLKHRQPAVFARVGWALHLPQYLSYLFTNYPCSDLTSLGCHTLLWDMARGQYHDWVTAEALESRLAPVVPAYETRPGVVPLPDKPNQSLPVGTGLHDSSAALIPYLATFDEPFLLLSTGTWCISMNPFCQQPLTAEELRCDCLCYLTYQGKPVKASRLFAGYEHEQQTRRLAEHFHLAPDYYKQVSYDARRLATDQLTAPPSTAPSDVAALLAGSPFAGRDLARFADYEAAYHQLMADLMQGQVASTSLVLATSLSDHPPVTRIFVDGGFGHNAVYMNLLAAAFPAVEVWAASVAQASALGAALAIHPAWNPLPVPPNLITLTRYAAPRSPVTV